MRSRSARGGTKPSPEPGGAGWVLGLDEAGRGSVLGPLVVGAFLLPAASLPNLVGLGVKDSKLLRPDRREEVYAALLRCGRASHIALPPLTIDRYVRRHGLNDLEAETFARLVRRLRPDRTFVDACDPSASRFGDTVARHAGVSRRSVDSRHKADRDLPIVGAASIVAKVRRDRAIARLEATLGVPIGSGYPSDPVTRTFIRQFLRRPGSVASWLRYSWATTANLKETPAPLALEQFAG